MHQITRNAATTGRIPLLADRVAGPVITAVLSLAAMAQALKVWQWRPGDPVDLSGDSASGLAMFKDLLSHGSYGSNPDLGAPFHQDASWFPHADQLHLFLAGKVIGLFSDNPFTVSAIYFFLGFPLAALSMYWLARQRHLGRLGSVVAGVLYSVLPGHQTMFQHLWLASYWVIPLGMWLVLRAALGEPLFRVRTSWRDPARRRPALLLNLTTGLCVLCTAIGGIYYSAFTLLLLVVALLVRQVATRDLRSTARASLLPAAIAFLSFAALMSLVAGQDKSTLVTRPSQRGSGESEHFAGKVMDLVLPWTHHRVDALQSLTVGYNSLTTPTSEQPALGVVALAGVVALLVILLSTLVPSRVKPVRPGLAVLGMLTLVALSFFSIGGLGSFVAMFVTAQIRTWSRLFVVIALFGLLAVGHWVTVVVRRRRLLGLLTAVALVVVGVLDQTNPAMAPHYNDLRAEVTNLRTFSQRVEARVGPGCSVFQLPVVAFPENPRVHDMADYAHFRPYLASSSLRWSYGAFRGTSLADWQLALPQKSTTALLDDLVSAGFCAVEVDRAGFADRAAALEANLRSLLGGPVSTTSDDRLLAWDLAPQLASLTSRVGAEQVKAARERVLHPVVVYTRGANLEHDNNQTPYQWVGPSSEIDVHNFGRTTVDGVRLTFSLAAPDSEPRHFTITVPGGNTQEADVSGGSPRLVRLLVDAVPGRNTVAITTKGRAVANSGVYRKVGFGRLIDVRATVLDPRVRMAVLQQRTE